MLNLVNTDELYLGSKIYAEWRNPYIIQQAVFPACGGRRFYGGRLSLTTTIFDGVRRYSVIFQDIGWIMDGYWMDIGRILDMDGYWIFADDNALGRVIKN